jgi:hypothetical protein
MLYYYKYIHTHIYIYHNINIYVYLSLSFHRQYCPLLVPHVVCELDPNLCQDQHGLADAQKLDPMVPPFFSPIFYGKNQGFNIAMAYYIYGYSSI